MARKVLEKLNSELHKGNGKVNPYDKLNKYGEINHSNSIDLTKIEDVYLIIELKSRGYKGIIQKEVNL